MKLVTFERDGMARVGAVVDGERVVDLAAAAGSSAQALFAGGMLGLLEAGQEGLAVARAAIADPPAGTVLPLGSVRLRAPILYPRKLFCLAGNYAEHILESGRGLSEKDRVTPRVFMKPPTTTVIGPYDPIRIPPLAQKIDWEAELAVVIGRRGKAISEADALDFVAGYTVINDVSERALKIRERAESAEWDRFFDWLNGKWLDTFAPMGPWIVTADEVGDPHRLGVRLTVNGVEMQNGNTGQMIFRVADIVSYISQIITLEPGDCIATGTPAGVGMGRGIFLKPGDRVRTEIEGIGALENEVVA
ncbi:MAG: fumarylacetoacetate hydrolase family protein [Armatimonadota bacterium]|nr:fumarylacetoacetate hydrolase family protein [Armatimonadota bacterium]